MRLLIFLASVVYFLFISLHLIREQAPHPTGVARALRCNLPKRPGPSMRSVQRNRFQLWPPSGECDDQPHQGRRQRRLTPCSLIRDQACHHSFFRLDQHHTAEPFPAVHRTSPAQSRCSGPSCCSRISWICCHRRTTCAVSPLASKAAARRSNSRT